MRKTFLKVSLFSLLTVGMATSFTACKDYDDDINNLQTQIDAMQKDLAEIKDMVSKGAVITSVTQGENGVTITLSNGNTYNITNGKNGENGKDGKDADVWTIVKNAEGAYVWAKNGEATEFPAQGPAGENGVAGATGNYFKPNAETGKFDEYKADGTLVGATNIEWRATVEQTLTAVDNGNTVTIFGLVDKDGNELDPQVLAKTGTLSGLEFIPDLYVNGIETMSAEDAAGNILKEDNTTENTTVTIEYAYNPETGQWDKKVADGVILAGETLSFPAKGADDTYAYNGKNTASYILNPNNANIDGIKWSFLTNDATIINRSSKAVANVVGEPKKDAKGNLVVEYALADKKEFKDNLETLNTPVKQTFMALQGKLSDGSVVSSNFVAVKKDEISFSNILYYFTDESYLAAHKTSSEAVIYWTPIEAIYNETLNLAENITIECSNGLEYNLAEIADKYNLTMNYGILKYTRGENATREDMYGSVNASTGVFTPMYVNAQGNSVPTIGAAAGRTAIGRQPIVELTLTDAEGNIVLGGFIKLVLTEKQTIKDPINLGDLTFGYVCDKQTYGEKWDVVAGQIVESTGMTILQFQNNYSLQENGRPYVKNDKGEFVLLANQDGLNGYNDFGTFGWGYANQATKTQTLTFSITKVQLENWYPVWSKDGKTVIDNGAVTTKPVTKTLYAKFQDYDTNTTLYVGYKVTVIGQPTINYNGQLASQWTKNYTVAPLNPAVAANKSTGADATKMTFTMASLWNGGKPAISAEAPYNFTNNKLDTYLTSNTTYSFAAKQNNVTGASGKVYGLMPYVDANGTVNDQILVAYVMPEVVNDANLATAKANAQAVAQIKDGSFVVSSFRTNGTSPAEYARDIVNAAPFSLTDPTILFAVNMNLTYGDCDIEVPAYGTFNVGVGRPLQVVDPEEIVEITDASGDYVRSLGSLASIIDWQNQPLWKAVVDAKTKKITGYEANTTVNGVNLWSFWMGEHSSTYQGVVTFGGDAKTILTNTTASLKGATELGKTREGFEIRFQVGEDKNLPEINVSQAADLFGAEMVYVNKSGNSVVEPFYIFVPVVAHYTWGDSNIGYATIKVLPTQTSVN